MTEEAFSEDDAKFSRQERFNARREMINTMKRMGVQAEPVQFDTPKGAINARKLREMYKDSAGEAGQKPMQIGRPMADEAQEFEVTGKPILDYFEERHIPKLSRDETPKKRTKK